VTSERDCIEALREAANRLGESPTKQQYEDLGLTPSAATILRVVGGWNDAKEAAGLETYASRGPRVQPKPDDVEMPGDVAWDDLSQDQRWHYRNREWNAERTLRRRAELRTWVNEYSVPSGVMDTQVTLVEPQFGQSGPGGKNRVVQSVHSGIRRWFSVNPSQNSVVKRELRVMMHPRKQWRSSHRHGRVHLW
jgi:hypothetical protein